METIRLRNGSEEAKALVAGIKLSIESLWETDYMAVYEFVCLCREPDHEMFGNSVEILKNFRLIEANGGVHQSIKNVMLSMVEGEGLEMTLVSPIAANV